MALNLAQFLGTNGHNNEEQKAAQPPYPHNSSVSRRKPNYITAPPSNHNHISIRKPNDNASLQNKPEGSNTPTSNTPTTTVGQLPKMGPESVAGGTKHRQKWTSSRCDAVGRYKREHTPQPCCCCQTLICSSWEQLLSFEGNSWLKGSHCCNAKPANFNKLIILLLVFVIGRIVHFLYTAVSQLCHEGTQENTKCPGILWRTSRWTINIDRWI